MPVIYHHEVTVSELPENATAKMHLLCVEIKDVHENATDLISGLNDTSWITQLNPFARMSYELTARRTIDALVEIFKLVQNEVTEEFGEYMVSISATEGMKQQLAHQVFPISELWKEKILGNHGFDFHTESVHEHVSFGEAKYNSRDNPYSDAASQILDFITLGKDYRDTWDLINFASPNAIQNLQNRRRGFAVAFSLNSKNHVQILDNALKSDLIKLLSRQCNELYIIGVKA